MADAVDVLFLLFLIVLYLLLPIILMVVLFVMSRVYRGMFDEIGLSRKEIGLLIVGSGALTLFVVPQEVPLVLYQNWFLAINIGGAMIPTVLSIHLLHSKRIPAALWIPGVLAMSLLTFLITRVQPSSGIVAEFPWLFIPPIAGAVMSLTLFSRHNAQAPAFAYATTTLGALIGADVFHMPELFQSDSFVGSIGGAGVFDLVYFGGLVSIIIVLVSVSGKLRRMKATLPHAELAKERVAHELRNAATALMYGRYQLSAQRSLGAVQARIGHLGRAFQYEGVYPALLQRLTNDAAVAEMYTHLARNANVGQLDFYRARWSLLQAQQILDKLQAAERAHYAPLGRRIGAFAVDAAIMLTIFVGAGLWLLNIPSFAANYVVFFGLFFWAFTIQVVYFTCWEYFWKGKTPGKALLRIRVVEIGDERASFIAIFTRNTIRLLDLFFLGYLVSILLVALTPRMQRIGDWIAETVVIRELPKTIPAPPQPIYTAPA